MWPQPAARANVRTVVAADVGYVADRKGGRLPRAQFQAKHGALHWQSTTNSMKMAMA